MLLTLCAGCGNPTSTPDQEKIAATKVAAAVGEPRTIQRTSGTPTVAPINTVATTPTASAVLGVLGGNQATPTLKPVPSPTATPLPLPYAVTSPTPVAFPGKGTVLERKFYSPILKREMPFRVYLPPGYVSSGKRYPVLYMLHGLSGSYLEWLDYKLFDTAEDLMSKNQIKPMIIVLPSGDQEYWVDHAGGGLQWGQYMMRDVVGFIDNNFRTIANRNSRAVGGHSMGGHGSLQLAFNYPDVFGVVGAHSPTLRTKEQAPDFFGDEAFYEAHDPVSLARTAPNLNTLKIWVDIGTLDDGWRPRAEELQSVLENRGIAHTWNEFEGGHAGEYWIEHVADYLRFYASSVISS